MTWADVWGWTPAVVSLIALAVSVGVYIYVVRNEL